VSGYRYVRPESIDEAVNLLARSSDRSHLLAGGTALLLLIKQGLVEPGLLVDLAGIDSLRQVRPTADGGIEVGALARLREIERDPLVLERQPVLASTIGRVATIRIRNQATLGGNLVHADPAQDPPPMLLALDAEVEVVGVGGRRTVPLDAFFVDVFETSLSPGEILTGIHVPALPGGSRATYEKFLPRTADDYATVAVAARVTVGQDGRIADARIALGAAGPVPMRVFSAEQVLVGRHPSAVDLNAVAVATRDAADPVDDARGSAGYKREMAGVIAARAVRRLLVHNGDGDDDRHVRSADGVAR
jgi:carbon-monoxide dehydrogenase medium subunit